MNDAFGEPQSLLVLGGGSDIARALTRLLVARHTRTLVLAGRPGSTSLEAAASEARALGADVRTAEFDAGDPDGHEQAIDKIWADAGDIDLVVFAFGVLGDQAVCEADPGAALPVATVDYTAAVTAGLAVAKRLRQQGHGTIVALSSVAGERVRRANFVYGSAKAGMDGFFQGLTDSLAGSGVKVIVVRPGFVDTKMTAGMPRQPLATTPDAVAAAIVKALSGSSRTIWVPAALRPAFAVMRHLPRAVWRRVPS